MSTKAPQPTDEPVEEKFYLPSMSLPPRLERIEAIVADLFDFHGVVLIPDDERSRPTPERQR